MALSNRCALVVTDGLEGSVLPSRFGPAKSTLLQYVLDSVWTVADEIFVIFDDEPPLSLIETIAPFGVKVAVDREGSSSFSMIDAGFRASASENCLVVSSSAPFVKPSVLFQIYESVRGYDAAIPRWKNGKTEALLAAYSRKAFLKASAGLKRRTLPELIDHLYDATFLEIERFLKPLDPELHSFFTIRSPADLRKARRVAGASKPGAG